MIALIADIHGNLPALQAVLADIDAAGCSQIISLGDVAGYYCMLNECIELMRGRRVPNLMGNHDQYLLGGEGCPRSQSVSACLRFQQENLTPENRNWLAGSKPSLILGDMNLVHGGWHDPIDEYLYTLTEEYFAGRPGRYFFSAHTHVQIAWEFDKKLYCNPGSVGQPRDGDPRAAYALFDGDAVRLRRVDYDIAAIAREMARCGFDRRYYENLFAGVRIGGGISKVGIVSRAGLG
jgi:predicted phosphodiesterase